MPSASSARLCSSPAATAVTALSPGTSTGTSLSALELTAPLPSCPKVSSPQASTVPLARSASSCRPAAEIARTPASPLTATGAAVPLSVPLPTSPALLSPHANTLRPAAGARPAWMADAAVGPVVTAAARISGTAAAARNDSVCIMMAPLAPPDRPTHRHGP